MSLAEEDFLFDASYISVMNDVSKTAASQLKCSLDFASKRFEIINMLIGKRVNIGSLYGTIVNVEFEPLNTYILLDSDKEHRVKVTKKRMRQILDTTKRQ